MKMKKIIYLTITALAVVACKEEPKDYVTFSGKITNQNSDSLVIVKSCYRWLLYIRWYRKHSSLP